MKRSPHKTIHIKRATLVQLFARPAVSKPRRHRSIAEWKYDRALEKFARQKPNRLRIGVARASTNNPYFFNGAHVGAEND
jgi:hypothetical protein